MGTSKLLWSVACDGLVSHPGWSRNIPSRFILRKPEISVGTDEPPGSPKNDLGQTLPYNESNVVEDYTCLLSYGRMTSFH